ncbi:MAG: SH3 domain-containing protein [Burkholderiales bacterium]
MIDSLNIRLDDALQEVVRAMGKLRSLASRAEAASGMAEADVALQSIAGSGGDSRESRQAFRLMQQSTAEFKRQNFGGALYLANQAKAAVRAHRLAGGKLGNMRPGERSFALPVKLRTSARANVRNGPGTNFAVLFTAESGSSLSGVSYLGDWIRVTNDAGNEGWISHSLVDRRKDPGP